MDIADLGVQTPAVLEDAAAFLVHQFNEPRGWPTNGPGRADIGNHMKLSDLQGSAVHLNELYELLEIKKVRAHLDYSRLGLSETWAIWLS